MLDGMTVARWSWLGDQLAIDVANTVRRRGWRYIELVASPADLRTWLEHERGRLAIPSDVDPALVSRFLSVRDQVLRLLRAAAAGTVLPAADVRAINELAVAAPTVRLLGSRPGQQLTRPVTRADPAARLCGDIAAATIDLLTGPDAAAVALCDAPGCGQLYLRGRPNQQWCNPHCGTRARSQRHAERHPRPGRPQSDPPPRARAPTSLPCAVSLRPHPGHHESHQPHLHIRSTGQSVGPQLMGRIRALGNILGSIVHRNFPKASIFPNPAATQRTMAHYVPQCS
jgi:predicted RNA-binding Zn ribbon-like protein